MTPLAAGDADGPYAPDYQRVNYVSSVAKVTIDGSNFGDHYFFIDTGAPVVVNGGSGPGHATSSAACTARRRPRPPRSPPAIRSRRSQTPYGYLSRGVSFPTTVNAGSGNDTFLVYDNQAQLTLLGGGGDDSFTVQSFGVLDAPVTIDGGTGHSSLYAVGTQATELFALSSTRVEGAGMSVGYTRIVRAELNGDGGGDTFVVLSTAAGTVTQIDGASDGLGHVRHRRRRGRRAERGQRRRYAGLDSVRGPAEHRRARRAAGARHGRDPGARRWSRASVADRASTPRSRWSPAAA